MSSLPPVPSDASVSFSVKELIGRVDGKLDILIAKIDEKASKDLLERLEARTESSLDLLEVRTAKLEMDAQTSIAVAEKSRAVSTTTRWWVFTAIPAAAATAAVIVTLIR